MSTKNSTFEKYMQYIRFRDLFKDYTVFSLEDIRNSLVKGDVFYRHSLNEWQDKGYIKKIVKGYYIFTDRQINENVLCEIANKIYSPSYVSLETALAHYNLIPEGVYGVTCAATRRTSSFKTYLGSFTYRAIKPGLFFGYDITDKFKIALPGKAILDYFYFNRQVKTENDFVEIRVDRAAFLQHVDEKQLNLFLSRFKDNMLEKRIKIFLKVIKNA